MIYTKKKFGIELQTKLLEGNNYLEISKWAFEIYLDNGLNLEKELDYFVLKLIAMEEGPEFILTEKELTNFAKKLIME